MDFFELYTNVKATNILFSSVMEVFGHPGIGALHTDPRVLNSLCNKLSYVKVEEYERSYAKLCTHVWHLPTSNAALVSTFFGLCCNCMP